MNGNPDPFDADTVFAPLRGIRVWNVLLPGFIDRDLPLPFFRPMPSAVYFALHTDRKGSAIGAWARDGFIRVAAADDEGVLTLSRVDEPVCPPELADLADEDEDEDDEFAVGGCGHDFLGTDIPLALTRVRYALDDGSDLVPGAFRCAEFTFGPARVFLDPMNFDGIRIQGAGAYEKCVADQRSRTTFGPVREHVWVP
ncbi:hypothetical protein [Streptomyces sp. NPDC048603]|uniref:hypothetical protein n=1 Tax=Streptomyces sp. NPDC048603 TaxID=3365577 RepID=UPI00370FF335